MIKDADNTQVFGTVTFEFGITICARAMCVIFRRRDPENLRL